jgi:hypothetical protein
VREGVARRHGCRWKAGGKGVRERGVECSGCVRGRPCLLWSSTWGGYRVGVMMVLGVPADGCGRSFFLGLSLCGVGAITGSWPRVIG